MYKFEISADSMEELEQKMLEFAKSKIEDRDISEALTGLHQPFQPPFLNDHITTSPILPPPSLDQAIGMTLPTPLPTNLPPQIIQQQVEAAQEQAGELDARGLPWDERIHASTKTFTKDGSWKYKRGVGDEVINKIESELVAKSRTIQSQHLAPVPPLTVVAPHETGPLSFLPPQPAFVPPPPAPTVHVEIPQAVVQPVVLPIQPVVASVPQQTYENIQVPGGTRPAHSIVTFKANLMVLIAQLIEENKVDAPYIEQLNAYFKVTQLWDINDTQLNELFEMFAQVGFITKV